MASRRRRRDAAARRGSGWRVASDRRDAIAATRPATPSPPPRDPFLTNSQCVQTYLRVKVFPPAVFISRGLSEVRTARFTTWIHDATFLLMRMCMFVFAALMWKWT